MYIDAAREEREPKGEKRYLKIICVEVLSLYFVFSCTYCHLSCARQGGGGPALDLIASVS